MSHATAFHSEVVQEKTSFYPRAASDWHGVGPIHRQMAAVRAIEGEFSILRSTRLPTVQNVRLRRSSNAAIAVYATNP
jgi:hypothetical protein